LEEFEVIIKNGHVVDGTGNPWYRADIGIKDGKIAKIGSLADADAERVIDASGLVVAPGFIDVHNHSDLVLLVSPKMDSMARQGVTTVVIGNCGLSPAVTSEAKSILWIRLREADLALNHRWSSYKEYLSILEKQRFSVNVVHFVGFGTIRIAIKGFKETPPTEEEMRKMKRLVAEGMENGAFGLSTGLSYEPQSYSETKELVELCKVVSKYGGIYMTHARVTPKTNLAEAVKEAIQIGEEAGVPVEISHLRTGDDAILGLIEEARLRGVDVTFDLYPYRYSAAWPGKLSHFLPEWVREKGFSAMLEKLEDQRFREKVFQEMTRRARVPLLTIRAVYEEEGTDGQHIRNPSLVEEADFQELWRRTAQDTVIAYCPKNRRFEGKTLSEIAEAMNVDPREAILRLLIQEGEEVLVRRIDVSPEDLHKAFRNGVSMVGL